MLFNDKRNIFLFTIILLEDNESPPKQTKNLTYSNPNNNFFDSFDLQLYSSSNQHNELLKKKLKHSNVDNGMNSIITSHLHLAPYTKAINMLKSIANYHIPFEKMMLISTISLEITECVNEFWMGFEHIIQANNLNIDADELMSLFIYIMIKSELTDLLIHLRMIKDFTTSSSKSSMVGYYYVTLEASLMYVLDMKNIHDISRVEKKVNFENGLGFVNEQVGQSILDDSSLAINMNNI